MKLKQRVNNLSLKKKIIVYTYLAVVPIMLIISAIMMAQNYHGMVAEQNKRGISRVQNLVSGLDELNQSVSEMCTYICINNDITEILRSGEVEKLNEVSQLWLERAPMNFIQDTLAIKGFIKALAIYPENGVQPYLRCMDSSAFLPEIDKVRDTGMYQTAIEQKGAKCWKFIGKNSREILWANQGDKIVLHREIYDLAKKNKLGYCVLAADAGKYLDLCQTVLEKKNEGLLVLNGQGEELLACGSRKGRSSMKVWEAGPEELLKKGKSGSFEFKDQVVYFQSSGTSGQTVCLFLPKSNIQKQLAGIAVMPLLMLLGVTAGLFVVMNIVSNIVTRPLKKVTLAMAEFRKGDFSQQVEVETHDEVGEAARCFNKMVTDIKLLIDEKYVMELHEKESELMALQAQINPHFLYNTLDSLYWQAEEAGNEEIAENILALSNLFRQVLGEGKSTTTVRQECALVEAYLAIQKMRFTSRLKYEIKIDEAVREKRIPKLILQPFVENAVVHGFESVDTDCSVCVYCREIPEGMEFTVEDTGIGMTKKQVEEVLHTGGADRYKGQRIGRYAIKNVKERLKLMYRENFTLTVDSEPGRGTRIILRIFEGKGNGQECRKHF